ncbi:39S ribosomal protein L34, mitochondrial [Pieris napi]|uniref:39S ribosomal protein L34, mitochondrial n=1 Tax=Pieris napi TaxID=78633 RepID=UPI001FB96D06|nr:39S ribosomal protein L34, mitochondrial [Pieris napi]
MLHRFISAVFQPFKQGLFLAQPPSSNLVKPESCLLSLVRTKVRCYFPRPNEVKRVRRHGWEKRMSSQNGRRVIMRRLLKGRHVLTH